MERRLGRGLGSLLASDGPRDATTEIPIDAIRANPFQPRRVFDPGAIEELANSIRNHGLLQPVVLRRTGAEYELIAGERRWRAARSVGLRSLPAVVREGVSDREMLELALVENVQRQDLNPMERAQGFRAMIEALGITQEQVAERVGLRRSTVTNHLRLLDLPKSAQDAIDANLIQMGHARALLGAPAGAGLDALLAEIVRDGLSVRRVEERVRAVSGSSSSKKRMAGPAEPKSASTKPSWARDLERRMQEHLGAPAKIDLRSADAGTVTLQFFSRDELDRLIDALAPAQKI